MRARNIKPGFFKNDKLADLPYEARLLFIGLWSMADREGRLEDRPKRIKAEIFPYDHINIEKLLNVITLHGFTLHYESNGNSYIQIINFKKHQNPHPHEAESILPAMSLQAVKCNLPAGLNPDVRNPESPILIPDTTPPLHATAALSKVKEWFNHTWDNYPKERRHGKDVAFKRYQKAVKTLEDAREVAAALDNYLASKVVTDGFVMRGSKWFDEWEDWKNDKRRSGEGIHDPANDRGQAIGNEGPGVQVSATDRLLTKLADSKAFPR